MKRPHLGTISIVDALQDARLIGDQVISTAQAALLKAVYGLALSAAELGIFQRATGCSEYVRRMYRDISVLAGRRSGKTSKICSNIAVFESCIAAHPLPPTERGIVLVAGPVEKQARITFGIILAKIENSPTLSRLIQNIRAGQSESEIQLSNGIDISVVAAHAKHVRGSNVVCAILEEGCFFRDSDTGVYNLAEVIAAIRPGMLTIPDSKLVRVSTDRKSVV